MAHKKKKKQASAQRAAIAQGAEKAARAQQEQRQAQPDDEMFDQETPQVEELPDAETQAEPAAQDPADEVETPIASTHALPGESATKAAKPKINKRVARSRLLTSASRLNFTRGSLFAAAIAVALGLGLVAQVQNTNAGDLENLRETDLVALLDNVSERADSLENEVTQLEQDKASLEGADGEDAAAAAAAERLESYQILAGTVPVTGQGIEITVVDPEGQLTTTTLIDLIQELRDAGSEAIQIGPVRVVASSWFGVADGELTIDGVTLTAPYTVTALGDSHTMAGALAIPGGFTDSVRRADGEVFVEEFESLNIDAVTETRELQYAEPLPATDGR